MLTAEVPATPLYSLMIRTVQDEGLALDLDGQALATGPDVESLRAKGLAELTVRAALAGRPVRVRAVEPGPDAPWLFVVSPDGAVTPVSAHPAPPPTPAPPAHPPFVPPTRAVHPVPSATLVPDAYREAWTTLWAAHAAGDLPEALAQVLQLERALEAEYGHLYPCTITVLTARAWLTLCWRSDWPGTVELLITTALRRHSIGARPQADTVRAARNAHAVWRTCVLPVDPQAALGLADPLADMLAILGEPALRRDVLTRAGEAFTRKPARQAAG